MTSPVSRGFHRLSRLAGAEAGKLPPGQHVTTDFPVLSAGPTPHTPLQEWTFSIRQGGETLRSWTWPEFQDVPTETLTVDIHCVTRWSKLGTVWRGVPVRALLDQVEHDAQYVLAFSDGGYTTNLPVKDVSGGQAWLAFDYDGQPLAPEHGGPARLLVPHLYFWKSAKWVRGLELLDHDQPGFWENYGYTTTGIHGGNSGTRATELAGRHCRRSHRGDRFGPHDRAGSAASRAPAQLRLWRPRHQPVAPSRACRHHLDEEKACPTISTARQRSRTAGLTCATYMCFRRRRAHRRSSLPSTQTPGGPTRPRSGRMPGTSLSSPVTAARAKTERSG